MTRDIKIYLLIVVLPAILLVAGGFRLVSLERERAKAMAMETLDAKAADLAAKIAQRIRSSGCQCRDAKPPKPPRDDARRDWRFRRRRPKDDCECRFHELPADATAIIRTVIAAETAAADALKPSSSGAVEIRHGCGRPVICGKSGSITGSIFGSAPIKPMLPSYSVCVAPAGGDAAVALGAATQALLAAILVFLLFGTLAAGVVLLARAARRARAEARAKTDFLSNVSHELKTPLTSIAMFSEMLQTGGIDQSAARTACATISRETKRLGRMIDCLLEYARLERGARKFDVCEFAVMPILEDAVAAFAPSFHAGIAISQNSLRDATVFADRDATRRIIDCLLENAAKYAPGSPVEIRVTRSGDADRVEISFADSGPGIAPSDTPHIFERFWRADNSVTRSTGGAGLGLAIAQELARGMSAFLSFRPNNPTGAIFALALPTS